MPIKALALAFLLSTPVFAETTPKVISGQCTVAETREIVRLRNLDPQMNFGKFAEAQTAERMALLIIADQANSYLVNVWGGVTGTHRRFAKKAGGITPIQSTFVVQSPSGRRRIQCHLVVAETR